jgi:Putative transposase
MAASQELTAKVHTIIRTTIGQYYVNKAVTQGLTRANIQPGSVTFIQRFGSAINVNLHFHVIFLEGVYVDRTAQGLRPRFVKGEPPPMPTLLQWSRRSVGASSARYGGWDTWSRASTRLRPQAMIPCVMMPPS